jgi:hypothetical protein
MLGRWIAALLITGAAAAAAPAPPLIWTSTTRHVVLRLTLPIMILRAPVLHNQLYREERQAMAAYAKEVKEAYSDDAPSTVFRRYATYYAGVDTPRLLSLSGVVSVKQDGDRTFTTVKGIVFDKTLGTRLSPLDLVQPGADLRVLDKAVCDAARIAKQTPDGEWVEKDDPNFRCPTWRGLVGDNGKLLPQPVQFTLAGGDVPGKAAGLIFFYSEYEIGDYADGAYEAILPLSAFQSFLKPAYASVFGGDHPKAAKPLFK